MQGICLEIALAGVIPVWTEFTVRPEVVGQAEATGQVDFTMVAPTYIDLRSICYNNTMVMARWVGPLQEIR